MPLCNSLINQYLAAIILLTSGKYDKASKNATSGLRSNNNIIGFNEVFERKWARKGMMKLYIPFEA